MEHQSDDPRQKRFALAHRLTDTYFHNFITHLLEAAFQRKVYTLIEEGETFGASKLNSIMKEVLTNFWGDAIEIDDDAIIGADISTDKPLRDTIQFLSDTVAQIIAYSAELGK